jgi:copper transport protein
MEAIALVRAAHFAAILAPPAILGFQCLIARPALKGHIEAERNDLERRTILLAFISAIMALFTAMAWFALAACEMSDGPLNRQVLTAVLTETHFGKIWSLHLALILALCASLGLLLHANSQTHSLLPSWSIAAAALATVAFAGHAAATTHPLWSVATDAAHLFTASLWPAGLLPVLIYLASMRKSPALNEPLSKMIKRFSRMSLICVPMLALTGLLNTWQITGRVLSFQTSYERILLLKILIFGTMVAIGAVNLTKIAPRLIPSANQNPAKALLLNVAIEAALGCAVLIVTGFLGQMPPR